MFQILGIAHGVRVLHDMSPPVIHGDITGQHVLIDTRGRPLLSEFWFTRVSTSMYTRTTPTPALTARQVVNDLQKGGVDLTQSKGVSEAIRFTACEHLMGNMFMTRATDVWAVAMTALQVCRARFSHAGPCTHVPRQLLTGDRPFAEIKSNNSITYLVRAPSGPHVRGGLKTHRHSVTPARGRADPRARTSATKGSMMHVGGSSSAVGGRSPQSGRRSTSLLSSSKQMSGQGPSSTDRLALYQCSCSFPRPVHAPKTTSIAPTSCTTTPRPASENVALSRTRNLPLCDSLSVPSGPRGHVLIFYSCGSSQWRPDDTPMNETSSLCGHLQNI
jgi:hypothetical protein